jgi:parallel beta-helix repeat protein
MARERKLADKAFSGVMLVLFVVTSLTAAFRFQSAGALPAPARLDNLIITTVDLEAAASRLAQWKNSCGIPSRLLNTSWIYSHYGGVDEPEKIRNCIKDYYDNFKIKYVTIFGDADKVPTRYVYVPDEYENLTATDLYYADLNGTWDDNHDGFYADQRFDYVDGVPEVCVGRIPVSLVEYSELIVDKIMRYQQQFDPSQDWTRRIVLAAGTGNNGAEDTHGYGSVVLNDRIANITIDKEIVKLYEKAGNLSTDTMRQEINRGALFVNFAGHGDPDTAPIFSAGWLFYWVLAPIWWNGFGIVDVRSTTNDAKLPVVTTCSCSTARFDDADCIGEWFVGHPTGGAIAYFGSTRIAYSYANDSAPHRFMGEMDWRIYQNFYEGFTRLGEMWRETVKEYVQSYVSNYSSAYNLDAKTIMEFVLLGDPSLRISNGPKTLAVPDDYATIQGAINDANEGDTVFVENGTYYEHVVVDKTINLMGKSRESTVVDGNDLKDVLTITSDNVNVSGFTFQRAESSPGSCIKLDHVIGTNISSNIARDSDLGHGIFLVSSTMNTVSNNLIINNTGHDCSICLYGSSQNILSANTVVNPNDLAMGSILLAYGSSYNTLLCNVVLGTSQIGIRIYGSDSSSNRVIGNRIENHWHGVQFLGSSSNVFYHNSIINNTDQVYGPGYLTTWSNGYPSGGNYWSDYNGTDLFMGTYQNESGNDGIGDNPYAINADNNGYQCRQQRQLSADESMESTGCGKFEHFIFENDCWTGFLFECDSDSRESGQQNRRVQCLLIRQ